MGISVKSWRVFFLGKTDKNEAAHTRELYRSAILRMMMPHCDKDQQQVYITLMNVLTKKS
jgi:hypothetical protein